MEYLDAFIKSNSDSRELKGAMVVIVNNSNGLSNS